MSEEKRKKRVVLEVSKSMVLRQYVPENAPVIFQLIDESREHLSQNGEDIAKRYSTEEKVLKSIEEPLEPKKLCLGIWVKDDVGEEFFVGNVNLAPVIKGVAELSCWIGKKHLGNKYAYMASKRLIEGAFRSGKTKTILAKVAVTNTFSIDVLEQLGFKREREMQGSLIYVLERS